MFKKILTVVLSVLMLCTVLLPVFAEETVNETPAEPQVVSEPVQDKEETPDSSSAVGSGSESKPAPEGEQSGDSFVIGSGSETKSETESETKSESPSEEGQSGSSFVIGGGDSGSVSGTGEAQKEGTQETEEDNTAADGENAQSKTENSDGNNGAKKPVHAIGKILERREPTCYEEGFIRFRCTDVDCGREHLKVLSVLHDYNENGICRICGAQKTEVKSDDSCDHSYVVTGHKDPTCTGDGYVYSVCELCAKEHTVKIKATGHNFVDGVCTICKAVEKLPEPESELEPVGSLLGSGPDTGAVTEVGELGNTDSAVKDGEPENKDAIEQDSELQIVDIIVKDDKLENADTDTKGDESENGDPIGKDGEIEDKEPVINDDKPENKDAVVKDGESGNEDTASGDVEKDLLVAEASASAEKRMLTSADLGLGVSKVMAVGLGAAPEDHPVVTTQLTITAVGGTKTYNGTTYSPTYTVSGLLSCDKMETVVVGGSRKDAGESTCQIQSYKITHNGEDVTSYYKNIICVDGLLKVNPCSLILESKSATKKYDGTPLTANTNLDFAYTGLAAGDHISVNIKGSQLHAGSSKNDFDITFIDCNASNYNIIPIYGTLTVKKRNVTLNSLSAEKKYNGKPLVEHTVAAGADKFAPNEGFGYNVTGSQTKVGKSKNYFDYWMWTNTWKGDYNISINYGTLRVYGGSTRTGVEDHWPVYFGGAAALFVVIVILVISLSKKKKNER